MCPIYTVDRSLGISLLEANRVPVKTVTCSAKARLSTKQTSGHTVANTSDDHSSKIPE
uniref:Uncharacterized protein n=1 Tax=Heterorhabditis bacteriophora TaxID=37862 RepID=A0A1I7X2Q7_HETBA